MPRRAPGSAKRTSRRTAAGSSGGSAAGANGADAAGANGGAAAGASDSATAGSGGGAAAGSTSGVSSGAPGRAAGRGRYTRVEKTVRPPSAAAVAAAAARRELGAGVVDSEAAFAKEQADATLATTNRHRHNTDLYILRMRAEGVAFHPGTDDVDMAKLDRTMRPWEDKPGAAWVEPIVKAGVDLVQMRLSLEVDGGENLSAGSTGTDMKSAISGYWRRRHLSGE